MASADFWSPFPTPLDASSTKQTTRFPRVSHTHLHAHVRRMYAAQFRASIGPHRYWPAHPDASPPIRFLFVRPALCRQLSSDPESPKAPLPFG